MFPIYKYELCCSNFKEKETVIFQNVDAGKEFGV